MRFLSLMDHLRPAKAIAITAPLLFATTACSHARQATGGKQQAASGRSGRQTPNSRQEAREVPADAANLWQTPDSYWTTWRDKRLASARPASSGRTYYASPNGSDDNPGTTDHPWRNLQKAAAIMGPGDTLLIADGEYPGNVNQRHSGAEGKPITYRAEHPGKAIVLGDRIGPQYGEGQGAAARGKGQAADSPKIGGRGAGDAAIQNPQSAIRNPGRGFESAATRDAIHINHADFVMIEGLVVRNAGRAGIRVDNSNNVTVRGCRCVQNGVWGIFSNFSDDLLLEYNEAAWSGEQHGIYVSNSGDRPVLRYNSCHDNPRAGIQLNGDSKQRKPDLGKRGDGIIEDATVEGNVLYRNGSSAASALNLACVQNSKIVNNLIVNNMAGGISLFNDHRRDVVEFGCKKNRILHNTIYFQPGEGRYCISIKHGSTDNVIRNNILSGGRRGAFEYDDTSSFVSDHNLLWSADPRSPIASDQDSHANLRFEELKADACVHTAPAFVNSDKAPYDFHLRSVVRAADEAVVSVDLDGKPRAAGRRVVGCYEEK